MRVPHRLLALASAASLLGCAQSTPPRVPTTVIIAPASVQLDALGASQTLTVTVNDQDGKPLTGVAISWASSAPAVATVTGTASGTVTAVSNGTATVTATAGNVSANAGVTVAQAPTTPAKLAGDAQSGTVGAALGAQLRVRIVDRLGAAIAAQAVTFAAAAGSGSVSPATTTTGADGSATTTWTLGTVPGTHSVTATASGATPTTFTATAAAGPPATVAISAGNNQTAIAGSAVATAPAVRMADAFDNPVSGVSVTFAIVTGAGTLTGATANTNTLGIATLGSWTLGTAAGAKSLSATVAGLPAVTFNATGIAGPPTSILASAGNGQTATVSTAVATPPAVRVNDANGNPVSGVAVTFAVVSGGGSATGTSTTTNVNGIATVGSWVLGAAAGTNTMTATAAPPGLAGNPVTFTATGSATPPPAGGAFNIELRFLSTGTAGQVAAFNAAATRWQNIVTADLPNVTINAAAGACATGTPALSEVIDDVIIFVRFAAIDGVGGVLGSAGPCFIRSVGSLPAVGVMTFDTADLANLEANGTLNSVILHEMGHVLGIGTIWTTLGLLTNPSLPSSPGVDTHFTGANAIAAFNTVGGATYTGGGKVPVENTQGGVGTRDGHWRESVLANELMTGFLNAGANPLSVLTIRSLTDLGYTVSTATADAFFVTLTANARASEGPVIDLGDDILRIPITVIDEAGRVVRVIRPPPE